MPYPGPRDAIPSPWYCSDEGVEIAKPLFLAMNRVGEGIVEAKITLNSVFSDAMHVWIYIDFFEDIEDRRHTQ